MTDDRLDALLRADAAQEPEDAGFTHRLLQRLPQRRRPPSVSRLPARAAQLTAMTLAVLCLGLLPAETEAALPALSLLGLLLWWSLPQSGSALFRRA